MAEQKEPDTVVGRSALPERRSTEDRLRALETMIIRPEWVKRVEQRLSALEQTIGQFDGNLVTANARLSAVERVAGLTPHMQNQIGIPGRTSQVRETHDKQVMDEALSRRKEAEDRVRTRMAERQRNSAIGGTA